MIADDILARRASELAIRDIDQTHCKGLVARLYQRFPGKARICGTDPRGFVLVAKPHRWA